MTVRRHRGTKSSPAPPGTGKTAIIERLDPAIPRMPEPAREVIADYRRVEGPDAGQPPLEVFVDLLLQRSVVEHYEAAQKLDGLVLFDRSAPDCIAYAEWLGTDPGPSAEGRTIAGCGLLVRGLLVASGRVLLVASVHGIKSVRLRWAH